VSSPRFGEQIEEDPSVCYRHPDRQSWVLCQRCGRTICPECQILAPVGVQCPECVQESGGSVQWTPTNTKPVKKRAAARRAPVASESRSGAGQYFARLLRPGDTTPVLSWSFAAVSLLLWIVGFFTANAPLALLSAHPGASVQIWRYFTAPFAYFSAFDFRVVLGLALGLLFWMLIAPTVERQLGRPRFLAVFFAAAAFAAAAMVLAGSIEYGLTGGLFGLFGGYAVLLWSYPPARAQILIIIAINLMLNIFMGGAGLPSIVGGLVAGAGATYLFQFYADRARSKPRTPYLIIGGAVAVAILAAILATAF
jgi:membrane associated rhomboid family serine protease